MLTQRGIYLGADYERAPSGLLLPPSATPEPPAVKPVGIDFFSGAGGFSCGFKMAGWHVAAAADGWAMAASTYLVNLGGPDTVVIPVGERLPEGRARETEWHAEHRGQRIAADEFLDMMRGGPPAPGRRIGGDRHAAIDGGAGSGWIANQDDAEPCEVFYLGDVRALTGAQILADLGREDIGAVFGGPPCQGFSLSGQRQVMDPRNSLVFEFMRLVCEIRPQTFCMENVPGIVSMVTPEGLPVLDAIARIAEDGGFGTYEAIKRALLASSGAGAAMRSTPVGRHKREKGEPGSHGLPLDGRDRFDPDTEDDQMDLFAGATA